MKYPPPVLENEDETISPALLIHWERVEENLRRMIAMARGAERLRPHVKTHKLPQIVAWQVSQGVTKCKCATIAEAEGLVEVLPPVPELTRGWYLLTHPDLRRQPRIAAFFDFIVGELPALRAVLGG